MEQANNKICSHLHLWEKPEVRVLESTATAGAKDYNPHEATWAGASLGS